MQSWRRISVFAESADRRAPAPSLWVPAFVLGSAEWPHALCVRIIAPRSSFNEPATESRSPSDETLRELHARSKRFACPRALCPLGSGHNASQVPPGPLARQPPGAGNLRGAFICLLLHNHCMRITQHNAYTSIEDTPAWLLDAITRHLSIEVDPLDPATESQERFGVHWWYTDTNEPGALRRRFASLVRGRIVPAGLTAHVAALGRHYGVSVTVSDARIRPEDQMPLWSVSAKWRPYQEDVHKRTVSHETGVIDAPPRSGKTLMAARVLDTHNLPSVYLAPSVQIVRQTYEVMCRQFGEDYVSRLDGDALPHQRDPEKQFIIATAQSAVRMDPTWWAGRKLLIVDEFHHAAADTYHRISNLAVNAYFRFGFTGTHFRTGTDGLAMEAVCSQLLYKVPVSYLVENGWLAAPQVFYLPVGGRVGAMQYQAAYAKGIVYYKHRNELVVQAAEQLAASGIPALILVRRRKHADRLGEALPYARVVKGGENALTSQTVRDFNAGAFDCLIGTSVLGEGVDVPRAGALIYAAGGGEGVQMMQSYFRPLTPAPGKTRGLIYDFVDRQHATLHKHSKRRIEMVRQQLGNHVVKIT